MWTFPSSRDSSSARKTNHLCSVTFALKMLSMDCTILAKVVFLGDEGKVLCSSFVVLKRISVALGTHGLYCNLMD